MSQPAAVPETFAPFTDLSLDVTGTFAMYATDEFFAPKEALVRPHAPEWKAEAYTERGKWMDGWESARRRTPGHDFAILRLGTPGAIAGVLCDTTHFKGNAPQEVSLEAIELPYATTVDDLLALPVAESAAERDTLGGRAWLEVIPRTAVKPDFANVLTCSPALARATHVRLRIFPDGGVARLRVYGRAIPEPETFWGAGSVDLAAVENGGTIAAASDAFFGPPANLLLPGRGVHMGDGWETKRRRTPGSDWCVVQLARRGVVHRLELDTHFFKGNAPQATRVECLDADGLPAAELAARLASPEGWSVLLDRTPLVQHRRHVLTPAHTHPVTHLRVHILPHGGVNRLRVWGHAVSTPGEQRALDALHALAPADRAAVLRSFCGADAFVRALEAALPARSMRHLFGAAAEALDTLSEKDWLEAFAAHPRLGESRAPVAATAQSGAWSRAEQAAIAQGEADTMARLQQGNDAYAAKFGFVFLLCATGRSAAETVTILDERLANDRATEIRNASREQRLVTRLRIGRWVREHGAD